MELMIVVHSRCEESEHKANAATMNISKRKYWWVEMKNDTKKFVLSCIHYIISRNGERIPRLLASALHSERPNEVIHAGFLYIGPAEGRNLKYVLIIKDDLSLYS